MDYWELVWGFQTYFFSYEKYLFLDFDTCNLYQFTTTDEDTQSKQQKTARRQPLSPSKLIW